MTSPLCPPQLWEDEERRQAVMSSMGIDRWAGLRAQGAGPSLKGGVVNPKRGVANPSHAPFLAPPLPQAGDAVGRGLGGDVPLLARRLLRGRGDRGGGRGRPLPPLGEVLGRFGRFWGHFGWIRGGSQPIKPPLIGLEAPGQDGGPHGAAWGPPFCGQEEGQDGGAQWGQPSWG